MSAPERDRVRELVTACLHYRVSGADADLLLYADVQRAVLAELEGQDLDLEALLDELLTMFSTAIMRLAEHTRERDPLSLWARITAGLDAPESGG